jgi:hypothetical protein
MTENNEETNTVIYTLDKELEDIGYSVDVIIEGAENHLEERINAEETESVLLSLKSHVSVDKYSVPSNVPPNVPSNVPPKVSSNVPPMYPPMYPPTYPPMYPPKYPPTYPPMYPTMYPPTYIPMYATMYPPIYLQQYLHT